MRTMKSGLAALCLALALAGCGGTSISISQVDAIKLAKGAAVEPQLPSNLLYQFAVVLVKNGWAR
jgi:hypothetical protein